MRAKQKQKHTPELRVVFDTSVLYTAVASDLVCNEVTQLIHENSSHPDLKVVWYMPHVAVHERQYQMLEKGKELLPSVNKLEKLLDHNLNVTDQVIERCVRDCVERQLNELNIQQFGLDHTKVDWPQLVKNALYRIPPFERGDKEKGFRDAIIIEEALQIIAASPTTAKTCRIAIVASDKTLADAVRVRTTNSKNVRVVMSLSDLKGLINTLVAKVTEDFVAELQERAERYFFTPEEDGFWTKEKLGKKIREKFRSELDEAPGSAAVRENGDTWYILPPRFVKKEGQRIFWASQVELECTTYRYDTESPLTATTLPPTYSIRDWQNTIVRPQTGSVESYPPLLMPSSLGTYEVLNPRPPFGQVSQTPRMRKALVASGKSVFEVDWSVSVSTRQKRFSSPKLEHIAFLETSWE